MTSKAQTTSNHNNAQKSTGPKSAAGKQRVSQNARRHGLSQANPDPALCLQFYRCIVENPAASLRDTGNTPRHAEAMALAQCEAHLLKVNNNLAELDRELSGHLARIEEKGMDSEREEALAQAIAYVGLPADIARQPGHWIFNYLQIGGDLSILEPLHQAIQQRRILTRYRAEAEAARHKALKRWLEAGERAEFDWTSGEAFRGEAGLAS